MDNLTFGRYIPGDSLIHHLDPRAKIMALFILLVAVFFDAGFVGYGIMTVFLIIVVFLSKTRLRDIFKALKPMLVMMIVISFFNVFLIRTGPLLYSYGFIKIYQGALLQTAYIIIRLFLIITLSTVLTSTTKPLDLTLGIEKLLEPLNKFNFPSHELAMMISIALRFIPDLIDETKRITKAQASRGVDFNEGTFIKRVTSMVSLIIPLFISSVLRAEDLANAMESRNYNPVAKRTRYKLLQWNYKDSISLSCCIFILIGIIIISVVF
ncbi:MAG: energy-coupling factor transporter transmembrane protein EcfT [Erysipelotrichaceae bacterium]|nr:energy-coupling factor transporter transmembrane protein EcfT [Erysipelotrichaceae bacterium]MDD3809905.1 energy-coupling factor transporter transmembrane protein EcfT [Erysipelotrichaceae bacterium]